MELQNAHEAQPLQHAQNAHQQTQQTKHTQHTQNAQHAHQQTQHTQHAQNAQHAQPLQPAQQHAQQMQAPHQIQRVQHGRDAPHCNRTTSAQLELLAFLVGAAVLVLEIAGSRLLAPAFGSSIFVWTAQIFTVLTALSLGYLWGGRRADKKDGIGEIATMLFAASLSLSAALFLCGILLPLCALFGAKFGPFLFSLFLFFLPCFFAGSLTPLLLRLYVHAFGTVGSDSGRLYAISTVGSMAGALLSAYFIIPFIGAKAGILLVCALFALCAIFLLRKLTLLSLACLVLLLFSSFSLAVPSSFGLPPSFSVLSEYDSEYFHIRIAQNATHRLLLLDADAHSMEEINGTALAFGYTAQMAEAGESFLFEKEGCGVGLLGLGAGSLAAHFAQKNCEADAYEIDPAVAQAAKKYFSLPSPPNLRVHIGDGRVLLAGSNASHKFDVLLIDAFASRLSIPSHLVTEEAFAAYSNATKEDGLLVMNTISSASGQRSLVFRSISASARRHFPHQLALHSASLPPSAVQNIILLASKKPFSQKFLASLNNGAVLQEWEEGAPFTDERSSVDYAMMQILQ